MTVAQGSEPAEDENVVVFREYLYADLARARSLLAQRLGGVPEEHRSTDSALGHLAVGMRNYLGIGRETKTETYEQRSLLDAIFPALEELLDAERWLTDISPVVHSSESANPSDLRDLVEPGSIIRLTAHAQMFDASYVAHTFAGTSAAVGGISALSSSPNSGTTSGGRASGPQRERPGKSPKHGQPSVPVKLEDLIEDFPSAAMQGMDVRTLREMVKVTRGMFGDGLHLLLNTTGRVGWTATARLQKGRQYLDAEPEILFSRYGTAPLQWTVVGAIGHFSERSSTTGLREMDFMNPDGTASRSKMIAGLNSLMALVANQGFADTPPFPGFSIIPLAVYRLIPTARD
ncbi:hypothetical protein [Pseudonocardia sp. MH-G8]|uniref:DUF6414 family protein n=1 Tax=Pseudonocardia sp. MH-G8 TaxID=1854588 RepID=UPI001179CE2D|nr:hypothetical protein [Pseudonocardia sp. MH-G8]